MNRLPSEKIRKYFKTRPGVFASLFWIILGVLAVYAANNIHQREEAQALVLFGGLLMLIGLIRFIMSVASRLSDSDIDNQFQADLRQIEQHALDKLGLDKGELSEARKEPLTLSGPIVWSTTGVNTKDILWKKGKDDIVRFAINRITVIYFTENLLGAYGCDFNFIKNVMLNEATDQYYYQDIVSVSTKETSTSYTLPNGTKLTQSQQFRLSVTSGEAIEVFIDSGKLSEVTKGKIPTEEAEKAVQVIRTILKGKKN